MVTVVLPWLWSRLVGAGFNEFGVAGGTSGASHILGDLLRMGVSMIRGVSTVQTHRIKVGMAEVGRARTALNVLI